MDAEVDGTDSNRPLKKQRLFIARQVSHPTLEVTSNQRQACEHCRQKKTRCDETHPCSQCKNAGLECTYGERKATKYDPPPVIQPLIIIEMRCP